MTEEHQDPNEPILREEYERRHAALEQRYMAYAKRSTRILTILVVIVLGTGALSAYLLNENSEQTREINGSLVENCEKNGNPLRWAVRNFGTVLIQQINDDIRQGKTFEKTGTYAEFFPGYPPDKLHALLVDGREDERRKIRGIKSGLSRIKPINCKKRFP